MKFPQSNVILATLAWPYTGSRIHSIIFSKEIWLDIPCESSAWHIKASYHEGHVLSLYSGCIYFIHSFRLICWGLMTCQLLWVILCCLPEQGRKEIEEIWRIWKRGTGKKSEQEWKWRNWRNTLQPLYNTVHYNTVMDITRFKDGSQKYIDYIEKWP